MGRREGNIDKKREEDVLERILGFSWARMGEAYKNSGFSIPTIFSFSFCCFSLSLFRSVLKDIVEIVRFCVVWSHPHPSFPHLTSPSFLPSFLPSFSFLSFLLSFVLFLFFLTVNNEHWWLKSSCNQLIFWDFLNLLNKRRWFRQRTSQWDGRV